jgi:fatty-acyl-CoA synthase
MFYPLTPIRCLHRAVDLFGNKVGVVSGGRQFTYAQFGERCESLASGLLKLGVKPGDRVAYLSFNNNALLEGYYGVIQARAILMPLNVRLSSEELNGILNHSGASVMIFESDFAPLVEAMKAACPTVEHYVCIDGDHALAGAAYEDVIASGTAARADINTYDEMAPAELFYTSGSTGTPKGVLLAHRTLYLHALNCLSLFEGVNTMVDLHTIPLFHANGWGRPQSSTMLGVKQVMVRRFDPAGVCKLTETHSATHMSLVPTMANALLNYPDLKSHNLSSLHQVMIGGAASSPELIERVEKALGCDVIAGYGMTETSPVLTTARRKSTVDYANGKERWRRQSMTGWAVQGCEVKVVDNSMNEVPRDGKTVGEIVARGDHIMEGYYLEPDQTAAVMSGQWIHTGDMAVWDGESYIQIVDRKKEIIVSGGENISTIEIERVIFAHPAVLECAVVAAPDEKWGEVPAAIVVRKPGQELTEAQLVTHLEGHLGRFKLPRIIKFQEEALPKSGTGKIRKIVLREQFWMGKDKRVQG